MRKPVRVLHIVGAMDRGGVENWLMGLLRHANRSEIAMDFLVHTARKGIFDDEILSLGARIAACPSYHGPIYMREFDAALGRLGPYDVVHSHVHWFSGLTTSLARRRGVQLRIAHSHSDTRRPEARRGLVRGAYRTLMRRAIFSSATHLLAASRPAAEALFGRERGVSVVYCGVDFGAFARSSPDGDRLSVRREFGIAPDEIVLGHVGAFAAPKNHAFLCSLSACAAVRNRRVRVLCVGTGPLADEARAQFRHARVPAIFCGPRGDVPRLLRAMDVFVFPSLYEGLPLAVVEAQAAGLPCVVSTEVTREVEATSGLIHWANLHDGPGAWAEAVLAAASQPLQSGMGLAAMRRSPFSIESSFARIRSIYYNN
jgi:glycosyltransferase involved in cell wall biosynthesis